MSRHGPLLAVLPALLLFISCDTNVSNQATTADPRLEGDFTLYRLDGDRYPGDPVPEGAVLLHGWPILQTCPIESMATRARLLKSLDDGIANRGSVPIDCFNPRHAIRMETEGLTVEYLICFQCQNYETWEGDKQTGGGLMSSSPRTTFNQVLDECQESE